ncbi:bacterio-opsin activator [Sulfolobus sp. A20]|nr:bacterio-opsin activator [Sulfolobus sp. A20]TRM75417.1 bacterio-opsin activator [Sulfolobus sp. A20-N-F8]TRM77928.1 bacterio-opsin activator [Sulfolobus sp. B5]TRM93043.1 bacterio-opsin activator [Sulfolobus sp. A20-N-G8]TRM96990.1 bacterio-opsin activator [Sulfolobus sp. B1]TRN00962.1 bacterio-opsin activator [Sulfolobus sp. E1]
MLKAYKMRLQVEHPTCWTFNTLNYDVKAHVKYLFPIVSKNLIFEIAEITSESRSDVSDFINLMNSKKYRRNLSLIDVERSRLSKTALMYYFKLYDGSITRTLLSNGVIIGNVLAYNGVEEWDLYYLGNDIDSVMGNISKELSKVEVKIEDLTYDRFEMEDMKKEMFLINGLTFTEKKVLYAAYKMGYFDYPKNIKLDDLAKSFGVTKVALDRTIRNGLRKILSQIFDNAK